jgi:hypothetical protein
LILQTFRQEIKPTLIWWSSEVWQYFGGICSFHLQGTLKKNALCSSTILLATYQCTWCHKPEAYSMNFHRSSELWYIYIELLLVFFWKLKSLSIRIFFIFYSIKCEKA